MRESGRLARNHSNSGTTITTAVDLLDLVVVETRRGGTLVLDEDLRELRPRAAPLGEHARDDFWIDEGGFSHGHASQPTEAVSGGSVERRFANTMNDVQNAASTSTVVVPRHHRTLWWKEVLIIGTFYAIYTLIRNQFGSALVRGVEIPLHAFTNAVRVIRIERALGLYHEETIQDWFLPHTWFIKTMNTYYGTAHFFVTLGIFLVLFKKRPDVFGQWRNTLAAMTGLALIGFVLFPLMPPRLLDEPCPDVGHGGACIEHELRNYNGAENFGFVDTIAEFGGPWAFDQGPGATLSNQYAAMPSLHIGWSTWCVFAMWPLAKRRWIRTVLFLYPATTLLCIVVTGNHFWLDGLGGLVVFAVGFVIGTWLHRWNHRRLDARMASHPAL